MTTEERQEKLFVLMTKAAQDFQSLNAQHVRFMLKEIRNVRLELNERMQIHVTENNIERRRIAMVLNDLDGFEQLLRTTTVAGLQRVISETADFTVNTSVSALSQSLGSDAISTALYTTISRDILIYLATRFTPDGLVLSDRIWANAGALVDKISSVIRSGILRGESYQKIQRDIKAVFDAGDYNIERLVRTEGNTAYRTTQSYVAQRGDIPMMLEIIDHPGHPNHKAHRCYTVANTDKYGKGMGLYKPTDTEIYNPHPNCTSYLLYVIDPKWLKEKYGEG